MKNQGKSAKIALIGETLEVTDSRNRMFTGMRGKVVDETRNTLTIMTEKGTKRVIKDQVILKVGNRTIEGKKLSGRIEARIKQ